MRAISFLLALTIFLVSSAATEAQSTAQTAYSALRAVPGKVDPVLERKIIEVSGRNGRPTPARWVVSIEDQQARGGVLQLVFQNGSLISRSTPVKSNLPRLEVIDLTKLATDSDAAFAAANARATEESIPFFAADHRLIFDPVTNRPVWVLNLLGENHELVGEVVIAADSGTVIRDDFNAKRLSGAKKPPKAKTEGKGFISRTGRTLKKTGSDVGGSLKNFGESVGRFFTGD